ncbi:hypothetical protein ABGB17_00995 [Sphaerisporangium sp. B11E5]|uniref:hypothetical protein n=1 Tax=Sphaerisporangium sp. B11E5 TaxID=3153563 RepID=UPI00325CC018
MSRKTPESFMSIRSACLLAAALAVAGAVTASPAAGQTAAARDGVAGVVRVGPSPIYNAPNTQDYEDTVQATFTKIANPDQVQFVLRTPPSVTWWKGIRLVDQSSGKTLASDFTQDAKHRTTVLTAGKNAVTKGVYIVFSKAKTFGAHTDMYTVVIPTADLGYRIDLDWLKDDR